MLGAYKIYMKRSPIHLIDIAISSIQIFFHLLPISQPTNQSTNQCNDLQVYKRPRTHFLLLRVQTAVFRLLGPKPFIALSYFFSNYFHQLFNPLRQVHLHLRLLSSTVSACLSLSRSPLVVTPTQDRAIICQIR